MKANIIKIGNSQGVILPASLLRQLNLSFKSSVELEVYDGAIVIKPEPRPGWAEAAQRMHAEEDDEPLLNDGSTEFEKDEWTW